MKNPDPQQTLQGEGERSPWPAPPRGQPAGQIAIEDLDRWRQATADSLAIARRDGLSKSEIARRADVPMGTFSPWYDGSYNGNYGAITARVRKWLDTEEERREAALIGLKEPGFVETRTAREVRDALVYAQTLPGIVLITLGAGMGKSTVAREFETTRPHAYRVIMRPSTSSIPAMMREVAAKLSVAPTHPSALGAQIGERLRRNGRQPLLIVDEAQNLGDEAVNELRYFRDEYGCGIALLGNEDVHARWGKNEPKEGYGQLHRRIDMRLRRMKPLQEDVDAFVAAWGIPDAEVNDFLRVIGKKAGALGQVTNTLKLAAMFAAGRKRPIAAADVRAAWVNRAGEELR